MKTRHLPEIDLARVAALPLHQQRKALEQMRDGHPPFSYAPIRSCFPDIFNLQPAMFGPAAPTEWSIIEEKIRKNCRSRDELEANMSLAQALHTFAMNENLFGRSVEFFGLSLGVGRRVIYWLPMVIRLNGRAFVPFIDPRLSRGLSREARRFVFSMMHERIRAGDPDFASVGLAILQFPRRNEGHRELVVHTDDGIALFSIDELETMVARTNALWLDICDERDQDLRRAASGKRGPLI